MSRRERNENVHKFSTYDEAVRAAFAVLLMISPMAAWPAQVTAASCSGADVGAAVASAQPGDEVLIPAGTCTWTRTLDIDRPLTLRGAGEAMTVLRDDVPKGAGAGDNLIFVSALSEVRITGFTVEGVAVDALNNNYGYLQFGQAIRNFRVDHLTFTNPQMPAISFPSGGTGVIDHCTFQMGSESAIDVQHTDWDGGAYGDSSWASPSTLGTSEAIFVEDCMLTSDYIAMQSTAGARLVLRYSVINEGALYLAGNNGRFRGTRQVEIYENQFSRTVQSLPTVILGGGTGIIANNTLTRVGLTPQWVRLEMLRAQMNIAPFGRCNGAGAFDENAIGGYACLDQVGRGSGNLISGDTPLPQGWPAQGLEPLYVWGNSDAGIPTVYSAHPAVIAFNRDWIEGTPRPGYTPYVYPHPFVTLGSDAGFPDAGVIDGGADAGSSDSGMADGGSDAGIADSGVDDGGGDSGIPDSGATDAGTGDGGEVGSDAGSETKRLAFAIGCGCQAASPPALAALTVLLLMWRRRS